MPSLVEDFAAIAQKMKEMGLGQKKKEEDEEEISATGGVVCQDAMTIGQIGVLLLPNGDRPYVMKTYDGLVELYNPINTYGNNLLYVQLFLPGTKFTLVAK